MLLSLCPNGWRTQRPVWGCYFDPGSLELLWLCCTKTFISHMLGTSETSQSEFASAQKGNQIAAESNTMMNTCAAWPIFTSITVQGWFFLSETFQKSFKGKVHPEGRITYSNLIAQNLSMRRNIAGRYWRISHTLPIPIGQGDLLAYEISSESQDKILTNNYEVTLYSQKQAATAAAAAAAAQNQHTPRKALGNVSCGLALNRF